MYTTVRHTKTDNTNNVGTNRDCINESLAHTANHWRTPLLKIDVTDRKTIRVS